MSMQINVDPAGLTQEQREAVAGFILAYPAKGEAVTTLRVPKATAAAVAANPAGAVQALAAAVVERAPLDPEIAQLAKEGGEFDASVAFGAKPGDPDAAAAFGSTPAPLALGATAAPFIAGAAPSLTAPENMTAHTLAAPLPTASAPPAPTSANAAPVVAPPTVNPAGGVELDKAGLPWDNRIHAGTKRKNADGSWTAKRGVDPALVAQVEAELRQVMGAAPAAPLAPAAAFPVQPAAPVTTPTAGPASSAVAVPAPPPATPVVQPPPAPLGKVPADARAMFVALVGRASAAIQGQKVTQAEVNQCCADAGVPALPLLANRLDLVAQVAAHIDALIAARQ